MVTYFLAAVATEFSMRSAQYTIISTANTARDFAHYMTVKAPKPEGYTAPFTKDQEKR